MSGRGRLAQNGLLMATMALAGCFAAPVSLVATPAAGEVCGDAPGGEWTSKNEVDRTFFVLLDTWQPGASARAFDWEVPAEYVAHDGKFPFVVLAGVPLNPDGEESLQSWGVLMFHVRHNESALLSSVLAPTLNALPLTFPQGPLERWKPSNASFFLSSRRPTYDQFATEQDIGFSTENPIQAGDRIGFVLMVNTTARIRFGLALTNGWPSSNPPAPPALDADAVLETLCRREKPAPRDIGSGFDIAVAGRRIAGAYFASLLALPEFQGQDAWSDNVVVTEHVPRILDPFARTGDVILSTSHEAARGWSVATATYYVLHGVGNWSVRADVRDRHLDYSALILAPAVYGGWAYSGLFGMPGYDIVADGPGASRSTFAFTGHSVDMISFNTFVQVDLDRPLEEVFGVPARTFDRIHAGLAGTMPPTTWEVVEPGRIWVGGETSHLVLLPPPAT